MGEPGDASASAGSPDDPPEDAETEGDNAADDRRLFEQGTAASHLFVACEIGVARVAIARDRIGQFELLERCSPTAIAAAEDCVAVGADGRILCSRNGESFAPVGGETAFEQAGTGVDDATVAAVGLDGDRLLAATAGGHVFGRDLDADESGWQLLGHVGEPRRFDGPLLAARDGIYRGGDHEARVELLGLADVRDVAALPSAGEGTGTANGCFAATDDGLYRFQKGEWHEERAGPTRVVDAAPGGVYAVDEVGLLERNGGDWRRLAVPAGVPVDIAQGESLYCVTGDGTVHIAVGAGLASDGHRGWRSQPLGLDGVVGVAVLEAGRQPEP